MDKNKNILTEDLKIDETLENADIKRKLPKELNLQTKPKETLENLETIKSNNNGLLLS